MTLRYCECCEQFSMEEPKQIHDLVGNDPYPMYQYHEACPLCGEWDTYEPYTVEHALEALEVVFDQEAKQVHRLECYLQLVEYLQNH